MTRLTTNAVTRFAAPLILATVLAGCGAGQKRHAEWVENATTRWNDIKVAQVLIMARQKFDAGDLDLAESEVKNALVQTPQNAKLYLLLGRISLERGKLERSYQEFTYAIEYEPELAEAYYRRGIVLQRINRLELAVEDYAKAFELEADNAAYLLAYCEMLVSLDRSDKALATLREHLDRFDANPGLRLQMAHIYEMRHEYDKAAEYFKQASLLDPENPRPREELAQAQITAGRALEASRTLARLLREPGLDQRHDLRRKLADALVTIGRTDDAHKEYLRVARSDQARADDWVKLGELAYKDDKGFDALHAARKAIDMDPLSPGGYLLAGMVWQKQNKLDEALQMFDRAAELLPDDAAPLILRGLSLQQAGRNAAAAEAYRKALNIKPDNRRARLLLDSLSRAQR